ncbi:hypothetical protein BJV85_000636 [Clostridium acetobutylicum]|uniref:Anti-sigma-W factor RsiW n=1 Tax=Clostridium acetobutylicum (strain ATCC 824 / DSM 792 / JCM 1419 / IAM 19013 / LMG 5710 / NBRC 13948 / NRRL B-527 / VKM B-1787 / 2291 / W) TaxID=272562 RepID=Q97E50_CLOAB|nr:MULTISPECIES: zf-HC2 domain-containing protein [Clostridium]AAK81200.1 Hypothetical protein CA_C3266 [Clostridium acetobutylicum ATCC 824]ADZ22305.1 hypothetical protein CEA_G3268 [Clostridium acetobutylicum EA 2018]AEI32742.1 hypothetical protein SMB_G3302 [Clostridium acetobutylicum DSM 1731]AWV81130.1 hypothetical protein DK921_13685 [Clostridium acetobutylicum]KHD35204.1 hypothetical protein NL50_14055 [Clostridium acetobutylicum]
MSCKFDKKLLYDYVDETIDELSKIFVEEHLKYCEDCREELQLIRLMDVRVKETLNNEKAPEGLHNLVDLILDNCMKEEGEEDINLSFKNYIEDLNATRKAVLQAYSISYKNPYNKAVSNALILPVKETQKILGRYLNKKVLVVNKIKKLLRVG